MYGEKRPDSRIPAEILMRMEARDYFENFKASIEAGQRQEKLEEDFEFLLAETSQVTPGRTLQDVSIFLQVSFSVFPIIPTCRDVRHMKLWLQIRQLWSMIGIRQESNLFYITLLFRPI